MKKSITFSAPLIKRYETDDFIPSGDPRFIAVSLNGMRCDLKCDHCKMRMLSALHRSESSEQFLELCEKLSGKGCRGMLLTGGCNHDGVIPLEEFTDAIREARERWGYRFAAHSKLATQSFADAVVESGVDLLMLDVVGDEESLHRVYHLYDKGLSDVEASLDLVEERRIPFAPHIMIGIADGRVRGELRALEMLKGRTVTNLCLVVLTPLRHTPMAGVTIDGDGVLRVLEAAREMFPDTRLSLGCAKTGGRMQRSFEEKALELAYDAIAYPSEGIVEKARTMGYDVQFSEGCCSFDIPF